MTDTKNHTTGAVGSLEGRVFRPRSIGEITDAIELAFDYRGDVTLELKSGESVVGYLFNRESASDDPYLELFPADRRVSMRIAYNAVVSIAFTGTDTANGNSWEAWVAKKESERRAESERVEKDARVRGHL